MVLWRILWRTHPLLLVVIVACSGTPRVTRVGTSQGKVVAHIPRSADVQPVTVEEEEFQQAMKRLAREVRLTGTPRETAEKTFQLDPLGGDYVYLPRDRKLVPMGTGESLEGTLTKEDLETAERSPCPSVFSDSPTM